MSVSSNSEVRILTPSPILGYGFPPDDFWRGIIAHKVHAIIIDAGSTDGGPDDLALGKFVVSRDSYERDLGHMLDACYHLGVKILIGTAGGAGSDKHVDMLADIISDMTIERRYSFRVATIKSNISKDVIHKKLGEGKISPCGPVPPLDANEITRADAVVAQMGPEPFVKVLEEVEEPDIIIGGRAYDPAPYIAFCMHRLGSLNRAVAWHMGKIMECGGICALPKGRVMVATVRPDHFDLLPMSPLERCTELSVAAHTLYEKTRPDLLAGPGGVLDLTNARYEQVTTRSVRVSGAVVHSTPYAVKLEGARKVGYKTIFIGGVRDPVLIAGIDAFLKSVSDYTAKMFPVLTHDPDNHKIGWHLYGKNAVMGAMEPRVSDTIHEIGVYGEVLAPTQALANAIANNARVSCLHMPYPGQVATAGNFSSPGTPLEVPAGLVCEFTIYHLMEVDDPADFPIKHFDVASNTLADRRTYSDFHYEGGDNPLFPLKEKPAISSFIESGLEITLPDLARVIRSKNSGPYELTFDVLFATREDYDFVKATDVLDKDFVKKSWHVQDDADILALMWFPPALAWKCTIKRAWPQGSMGERDTFGTAQHAPLMDLVVRPKPMQE